MTAGQATRGRRRSVQRALLAAVRFYQRAISPTRPPRCRFVPSCSAYAVEALELHGALRGSWLALCRLLKCAPWHRGGVDLVPQPASGRRFGTPPEARSSKTAATTSPAHDPVAPEPPAPEPRASTSAAPTAGASSSGERHPAGLRPGSPAGDPW